MRKLQTQDVFKFARIMKSAGLKEEIRSATQKAQMAGKGLTDKEEIDKAKEEIQSEIGVDILIALMDSCASKDLEEKVYDLLSGVFEVGAEDVKAMSLDTLIEKVKQLAKENNLQNFMNAASRMNLN